MSNKLLPGQDCADPTSIDARMKLTYENEANYTIKRYMMTDMEALRFMCNNNTYLLFGNISIHDIVLLTYLTLVMRDADGQVIASLSVNNFPNLLAISACHWPLWLFKLYRVKKLHLRNTMWIHLYLFLRRTNIIFTRLLKDVFERHSHVQYIAMIIPPNCYKLTNWMSEFGTRINPTHFHVHQKVQAILIIDRNDFMHQYKLRRACEEDNDDILPLIDAHAPHFKELYGEAYPALLAKKRTSGRNVIIAEYNGKVVATLCLNSMIAMEHLIDQYELETLYGLHKIHPGDDMKDRAPSDHELFGSMISIMRTEDNALSDIKKGFDKVTAVKEDVLARDSKTSDVTNDSSSYSSFSTTSSMEAIVGSDWMSSSYSKVSSGPIRDRDSVIFELDMSGDSSTSSSDISRTKHRQSIFNLITGKITKPVTIDKKAEMVDPEKGEYDVGIESEGSDGCADDEEELVIANSDSIFNPLYDKYGPLALSASIPEFGNARKYLASISKAEHSHTPERRSSVYQGDMNCFAIEIAVAAPGHEAALQQLVATSFQCYPKRAFCILTLPTAEVTCPMMKMFVRVPPRPCVVHREDLYVVYRGVCSENICVRKANTMDIYAMEDLIFTTHSPEELSWLLRESLHRKVNEIYLLLCDGYVIGFTLIRMERKVDYIKQNYELEMYTELNIHKAGCIGRIEYVIMSLVFQGLSSFFLTEVHRLSGYTLLTYYILPQDGWRYRHLAVNLGDLMPIKPRKKSEIIEDLPTDMTSETNLSALYISTLSLCSLPRKDVNTKIVIVGTSITAMAFLETLLFNTSAQYKAIFNNVFVVAPSNAMLPKKPSKVRSHFFVRTSYFDYCYLNQLGLKTYVNFITGVMTQIKRPEKAIIIDDSSILLYDYLFLLCGQQFTKPTLYKDISRMDKTRRKKVIQFNKSLELPKNVFIVNSEDDASVALKMLKMMLHMHITKQKRVIVYGRCLEAYCCLSALLEFGIAGRDLIFIECPGKKWQMDFTLPSNVEKYILETLEKLGITVYLDYRLYDYMWNEKTKMISSAIFEMKTRRVTIECTAMFAFTNKRCSSKTFLAIHNASLVFDGGIVINSDCTTHDQSIYAAGPLTKFSRRFHAEHLQHGLYSSQEVGYTLGKAIRVKLIPNYDETETYDVQYALKTDQVIKAKYNNAKIQYCKLPGKLFYLSVRQPGKQIPSDFLKTDNDYASELITGNFSSIESNTGYFKLYLNQYGCVERITCLSQERIHYFNLVQLFGKHEKMLNNLKMRFKLCKIGDLHSFFKEPWSTALYNSQYLFFENDVRQMMMSLKDVDGELLSSKMMYIFEGNEFRALQPKEFHYIEQLFLTANYDKKIADKLINFFMNNIDFMNMYAHPIAVRNVLEGYMDSSMFRKM